MLSQPPLARYKGANRAGFGSQPPRPAPRIVTMSAIAFRKMNGLGNDFAVLDGRARALGLTSDQVRKLADRKGPVGCDQVIVLEPSERADVFMRIYNADGGEVEACGNAARCVGSLLAAELGRERVAIETGAEVLGATLNADGSVTIESGPPRFAWNEIPLSHAVEDTGAIDLEVQPPEAPILSLPSVVNVGNPHCIFFVDDAEAFDLAAIGPALEHDPLFPERANISLAQLIGPDQLKLRVWERGAGLTQACGTAACAAAIAAHRKGLTGRRVIVHLPGGMLDISWCEADGHILMTGPVALDFEGAINPDSLALEPT